MSTTTRGKRKRPIHDIYETSENVEESQRSRRRINGGGRVTPSKSNTQTPQSYKSNELASLLNSSDDEEQDDDIAPSNNKNNNNDNNSKNDNNTSFGIRSRSRDSSRRRRQTSIYTNKFNQNNNNNNNENNNNNNNNNNSNNDSKDIEEDTSTTTAVKTTSEIVYPKLVKTSLKSNNKKSKLAVGATTLKKRKLKSKRNDVLSNDDNDSGNENENEREHKESSPKSEKYSKKRGSTDNGKNNDNNKKRKTAQSAKKAKKAAKSRNSFENEFETVHTSDLVTLLSSSPSSESDNDNNQNKERDKDGEGEDSSIETSPNYNKDDENDNDNENENQDRPMPDRKRKKPLTTKPPRSAERDPSNLHDNDKNKGEKSKRRHSLMDNDRNEDNEYNEEMELEGIRNEGSREGYIENDNDDHNDRGRRNSKATTTRTRATFYTTHSHSRGRNNNVAARGVGGARSTSRPRSHLLNKNKNKEDNGSQIVQGHSRNSGIFSQNIRDDSRKELRHGLLPMPEPRSGSSINHSNLNNESQIVNLTNYQDNNSFAHRKHELNLHSDPRSNIQSRIYPQRQGYLMEPGSPQHQQQQQQQQRKRRRQTENWGNKYDNNDNDRNRNDEYDSSETESDDNDDNNNIGPQLIGRGARNSLSPRRKPLGMNSPTNINRDFNKSNIIGAQFMVPPNVVGNMNIHRRHSTMQQQRHQHQPQTQRPTSLLGQSSDIHNDDTNGMNSPIIRTFESDNNNNNNNNLDRSFNMSNRFFHSPKSISAMKRRRPIVINPNGSPTKLNFDGTGDDNDNGNDNSGIEFDNGGIPSFLTTAVCFFYENPRLGAFGNTIAWIIVIFWNIYRFKFVIFSLIVFYAFYIIFCNAFNLSTFRDFLSFMGSLFLAKPIVYCDSILNDDSKAKPTNCETCPQYGFCTGGEVQCQDGRILIDGECLYSTAAINEMEAKIPRLIVEILTKRRGMYECYEKYQLWPSCMDLSIAVDFDQSLTCQLDDSGDKRVFPIKSMEMKRNDLKVKLAHLLKIETTNYAFVNQFTDEITRLMHQTGEYKAELKRVQDLIAKEQIKEKHNVFDDVIAQAERMERNNQENEKFNRKEQKDKFEEIKEHEKRRMELQKMQERVKEPLIMYNAQDGTLYATIGKKTVKCLIYDWCYEHVLLLVFIMFSIYWISRWTYRRNKFAKQKKKVNQIKHEILLFLKQRRHHNPPYVSIEQAKIHCVPIRFDDTIWEMAKEAVENDPNVQKSTRAIDGVQRTCWKISQTAFLHD